MARNFELVTSTRYIIHDDDADDIIVQATTLDNQRIDQIIADAHSVTDANESVVDFLMQIHDNTHTNATRNKQEYEFDAWIEPIAYHFTPDEIRMIKGVWMTDTEEAAIAVMDHITEWQAERDTNINYDFVSYPQDGHAFDGMPDAIDFVQKRGNEFHFTSSKFTLIQLARIIRKRDTMRAERASTAAIARAVWEIVNPLEVA